MPNVKIRLYSQGRCPPKIWMFQDWWCHTPEGYGKVYYFCDEVYGESRCWQRRQTLGCLWQLLGGGSGRVLALLGACLVWTCKGWSTWAFSSASQVWGKEDTRRVGPKIPMKTPSLTISWKTIWSNQLLTRNTYRNKRNPQFYLLFHLECKELMYRPDRHTKFVIYVNVLKIY